MLPGRALVPYPPEQFDVVRAEALATGSLDLADARRGNTAGGDKYLQSLAWDRIMQDRLGAGEVPAWTRDIAAGAPFVPQMAQVYEPINLLLLLVPSEQWYGLWLLLHQLLFGYLGYLFLRRLGCSHAAALLGLVAAVLGLWTQCKVHHNVILTAALPLWPMLSGVWDLARRELCARQRRRTVGWLALWTGVSWLSGFAVVSLQVTYLTVGFALLLALQNGRGRRLPGLLPAAIGIGLGGLLSLAHMIPVLQASATSARLAGWNPEFLAAHGLDWDHALTALWPDLLSWPADVFYPDTNNPLADITRMPWSQLVLLQQPLSPVTGNPFQSWVETAFAVGTAPLCCALVALFDRGRRAVTLFFALAGALAFGFATADQPLLGLARFVPGIAAADLRRLLFTVAMALVVLSALGADRLLRGERRWPVALLLAVTSLGAGYGLFGHGLADDDAFVRGVAELIAADTDHPLVAAVGGNVERIEGWIRAEMAAGELDHNRCALLSTALRALGAAALIAIALWWLRGRARIATLLAVTIAELLHAGLGPVQTVPADRITTPPAVVAPVLAAANANGVRPRLARLAAATDGRIASWYPGNLPGFHGIEDATGYNPLPAARFEEFFTAIEPPRSEPPKLDVAFGGAGVGAFHDAASLSHPLCDLFGIRFVLTGENVEPTGLLVDRTPPNTGRYRLLERLTALPRATFVRAVDIAADKDARLRLLGRRDRDVATRVVLEASDSVVPTPLVGARGEVTVISHSDERVVLRVRCDADGYVRLADPYDAGWRVTVNGEPRPVLAADHYLRAVYVGAGEHEVVFTYDAFRTRWPRYTSLIALLAIAVLVSGRGSHRRSR